MNPVQCNVALATGRWRTKPTLAAVRNILGLYFGRALQAVEAVESEPDVVLQLEVTACMGWGYGHAEAVRDRIAEALLGRFRPEYESMVEMEVVETEVMDD